MSDRRRLAVAALLAVGAACWLAGGNEMPWLRWAVVGGAVGVAMIPRVSAVLAAGLERVRRPSRRAAEWAGVLLGVAATVYLIATAFWQDRDIAPNMQDEASYVIGARMLAQGRLWMPQHSLADFFETFFVAVKPVYCSIYFPGTALMFAPMEWFDWGKWILPVVISGVIAGLLYRLVTDLVDGVAGLLAVVWLVGLTEFRTLSFMVMSHLSMLLLGVLIVWAWLRWRRDSAWGWALAVGAFSGWAAITRPADALAYAIPVGVAMAAALWRHPPRRRALTAAMLVAGAAPFLAVQVVFNVGVTGHPLRTPYTAYLEQDQPGAQFGIRRYDPSLRAASALPQKQAFYDWSRPYYEYHQPHNFWRGWVGERRMFNDRVQAANFVTLSNATLPSRALLVLLPVGLLALDRRRWVLVATLPLFVLLYLFNPFFLRHYAAVVIPGAMLCALLGVGVVAAAVPPRWGRRAEVGLVVGVLALSVTSLWEVKRFMARPADRANDGFVDQSMLSFVDEALGLTVRPPAVVLFTPQVTSFWEEAVYNTGVAWPDDAPIIRAHHLGERDREIIEYYAERQPERTFYFFDRSGRGLVPLGNVVALRDRLRAGATVESLLQGRT